MAAATDKRWSFSDLAVVTVGVVMVVGLLTVARLADPKKEAADERDAEALVWCEQRYATADDDQLGYRSGDLTQLDDLVEVAQEGQDLRHSRLAEESRRMWGLVDREMNGSPVLDRAWFEVADAIAAECAGLDPGRDWLWMRT